MKKIHRQILKEALFFYIDCIENDSDEFFYYDGWDYDNIKTNIRLVYRHCRGILELVSRFLSSDIDLFEKSIDDVLAKCASTIVNKTNNVDITYNEVLIKLKRGIKQKGE